MCVGCGRGPGGKQTGRVLLLAIHSSKGQGRTRRVALTDHVGRKASERNAALALCGTSYE